MDEENRYLWENNRTRRLRPKRGVTFCWGCDAYLVGDGQKCPRCGTRHGIKRYKKKG